MKRSFAIFVALMGVSTVLAAKPPAVVEFDKASPEGGNGKVTAAGTYIAEDGWEPVSVKLWIVPKSGGRTQEVKSTDVDDGEFGPLTINDVKAGEYSATVFTVFRHETKGEVTIASKLINVKVP